MLDLIEINKIKAIKPGRKAKEELYKYAVELGLQEGIKQTFHITKMIEIMERNDVLLNSDSIIDKSALLTAGTKDIFETYNEELNKVIPEFVDRLKSIEQKEQNPEDKVKEEELIQEISLRKNIPSVSPIGKSPSYIIIPFWIYDYIINNSTTWYKVKPPFKDKNSYDTALSLIYYIRKDGAITVRETRFSSFHTFIKG